MLAHTAFSFAQASPSQLVAFFGGAVVTIAILRLGRFPRETLVVADFSATGERRVRQADPS